MLQLYNMDSRCLSYFISSYMQIKVFEVYEIVKEQGLDKVVNTFRSQGFGSILIPCKAGGHFLHLAEREAASLPLVGKERIQVDTTRVIHRSVARGIVLSTQKKVSTFTNCWEPNVNQQEKRDTENKVVRLMMFPLSLTGEAKTWLDELSEGTIETWDELRTAFISRFFPQLFSTESSEKSVPFLNMKTNL
nr:reverse transcriptase domain-containing protein [Tanacetum cinerariifolium]